MNEKRQEMLRYIYDLGIKQGRMSLLSIDQLKSVVDEGFKFSYFNLEYLIQSGYLERECSYTGDPYAFIVGLTVEGVDYIENATQKDL
ncbi:hypothetical protein G5B47_02610 [Paenibacillus sp. 7124]|uniref:Uncharacterized protein n=1 Tax=Paenibacillus apii TaxID=1850370 RepID=A0A6M1PDE2_9BACL|nr:hypothetical protein [Paenibacillus apii]NGM81300.1 hypothetical protein [Paenibacillus apii]